MAYSIIGVMKTNHFSLPYTAPCSRVKDVQFEENFLASGDFGQGGYPGQDLEPGDEFDF